MREILFRGKQKSNGNWVYGDLSYHRDGRVFIRCWDRLEFDPAYNAYEVNPETVGQFTGLTDKDGTDIFEGDIIRAKIEGGNHSGFTWQNMPVDFQQGSFCLNDRNGYVFCVLGAFASTVTLEVIGNIHDNPELLED